MLYATGEISETTKDGINCFNLVPEIVKLAEDDNVKGLVLRVNSPGGSVFGSSEIAEALQYFKSKKNPLQCLWAIMPPQEDTGFQLTQSVYLPIP